MAMVVMKAKVKPKYWLTSSLKISQPSICPDGTFMWDLIFFQQSCLISCSSPKVLDKYFCLGEYLGKIEISKEEKTTKLQLTVFFCIRGDPIALGVRLVAKHWNLGHSLQLKACPAIKQNHHQQHRKEISPQENRHLCSRTQSLRRDGASRCLPCRDPESHQHF